KSTRSCIISIFYQSGDSLIIYSSDIGVGYRPREKSSHRRYSLSSQQNTCTIFVESIYLKRYFIIQKSDVQTNVIFRRSLPGYIWIPNLVFLHSIKQLLISAKTIRLPRGINCI